MRGKALLIVFAVAGLGGFLGSNLGSQMSVSAASAPVVRASRFELTDGADRTLGVWETDTKSGARLRFLPAKGTRSLLIGVGADGIPILEMEGLDRKARFTVTFDEGDKPYLVMGDERSSARVNLGFIPQDTTPSSADEWGLLFRVPGGTVAGIGMLGSSTGTPRGFVNVRP